jgi:hypothetical protein
LCDSCFRHPLPSPGQLIFAIKNERICDS